MGFQPLCAHSGLWGTACCLLGETVALALELLSFGATAAYEAISKKALWTNDLGTPTSPELLRATFVAAYPRRVLLFEDWRGVISALLWLTATSLISWVACRGTRAWLWRQPEVFFFPDESGTHIQRICTLLESARKRVWLAMFTLTDDTLADELLRASRRGVDVRVVLDDEQCQSPGADGDRLGAAGISVLKDSSKARMHHKFAIIDNVVLSGSFNWTKQASVANSENVCLLREPHIVRSFANEFRNLWQNFNQRSGKALQKVAIKRRRDCTPPKLRARRVKDTDC